MLSASLNRAAPGALAIASRRAATAGAIGAIKLVICATESDVVLKDSCPVASRRSNSPEPSIVRPPGRADFQLLQRDCLWSISQLGDEWM